MNDTNARPSFGHTPLPDRAGAGFKPEHAEAILAEPDRIGFIEVHAENYMGDGGVPHRILARMRSELPLSVHGVGLSIGSESGIDPEHLARLAHVVSRYEPGMVSEHLAWSTHDNTYFNDLLPVPYDAATLRRVAEHIETVQNALGRQILLENPSTYVAFEGSDMSETDFIREVARRSGCGLLLDVNNVFVSAANQGFRAIGYLRDFPLELVQEIHLAGHAEDSDDEGAPLLIDAHDRPVADPVWALYDMVISQTGPLPTLIEWDNDVPDWPILRREARLADGILDRHRTSYLMGSRHAG
ncbi:DUF692 domain-containing protein [Rhizobium sp. TRM95111]|uniref:MNIO family bufferin maturase n=1 Tax=Rhizobium alarense TaxID=2846851 RepID=UPI001F48CBCE|nr:DUF692 domain-containing protein [Rhizobium alarense]MCF3640349.1 DUF692 domain-containing protein [Rhizobium alarense]